MLVGVREEAVLILVTSFSRNCPSLILRFSIKLFISLTTLSPEATPSVFIPFTENDLRGHHEPLMDISTRTSRVKDFNSVQGKKWGEGYPP